MIESTSSPAVRFYCTAGNGMENFLLEEVKAKLAPEYVDHIPGKVFFSCTAGVKRVKELKTAERLFLLLRRDSSLLAHRNTVSQIQSALLGDGRDWSSAVETWRSLQRELTSSAASTVETGRKRKREEDENGPIRTQRQLPDGETRKLELCDNPVEHVDSRSCGTPAEAIVASEGDCVDEDTCEGDHGRASKRVMQDRSDPLTPDPVTFRVNCKCSGVLSRCFTSQDLSRILGTGLSRQLSWRVDLKKPELEVNVYLSDDHCVIGIPLLSRPLASRVYMQTTGLRSTIAWALGSLADIQPGSRVLDPMCGVGTVLLEAAQEHQEACFLGVDIDEKQLMRARGNVEFAELTHHIQLLQASSMELPLASCSVDAVVCDLPFGKKFGTKADMAANLPGIVAEMERVLRVGGTMVLLLSPQLSSLLRRTLICPGSRPPPTQGEERLAGLEGPPPLSSLELQASHRVSLGAIDGLIHKYVKLQTASTLSGPG